MPTLVLLILFGIVLIWFLLSPLFSKIGSFVIKKTDGIMTDEDKNNKEEKKKRRIK